MAAEPQQAYLVPGCQLVYDQPDEVLATLGNSSEIEATKDLLQSYNESLSKTEWRYAMMSHVDNLFTWTNSSISSNLSATELPFANHSRLMIANLHDECAEHFEQCRLDEANTCIKGELALWDTFLFLYLPVAVVIVLAAIILNLVTLVKIAKNHVLPPVRRALIVNLVICDTLLCTMTLVKRCCDFMTETHDMISVGFIGNMIWQACWIVSTIGLLILVFNVVTTNSCPRSRPATILVNIFIVLLWIAAIVSTGLLEYFGLAYSMLLQVVICMLTLVIFVAITLILLGSCCASCCCCCANKSKEVDQGHDGEHDAFIDHSNKPLIGAVGQINTMVIPLKKARKVVLTTHYTPRCYITGTIAILLLVTILSWAPLVAYFLMDEQVHYVNVIRSQQLLAVSLIAFHLNAIAKPIVYLIRFGLRYAY